MERSSNLTSKFEDSSASSGRGLFEPASISLPKGGGSIRGMGEKFSVNPVTGTGSLSVPIYTSPARQEFHPKLSLSYDSGAGNSEFGLGWSLSIPAITRKTSKGLPTYSESDIFLLSGAEDLVPIDQSTSERDGFSVQLYRPRVEGLFSRVERWLNLETGLTHWRTISKENVTSIYGQHPTELASQISDPQHPLRVYSWLLEASYDDKGNVIVYEFKVEDNSLNADDPIPIAEQNRIDLGRGYSKSYLKRIRYGNTDSFRQDGDVAPNYLEGYFNQDDWLFQVVFDYGDHDLANPTPEEGTPWVYRQDSFSEHRAGFEVRTQRLCQRVLMFHRMGETGDLLPSDSWQLVHSTDLDYEPDPVATYLTSVTQTGYAQDPPTGLIRRRSYPPLTFQYDRPQIQTEIQTIDPQSLQNLTIGLDGSTYQWVDLDSDGIAGILTEQANGWLYKRNLGPQLDLLDQSTNEVIGPVRFDRAELVASTPSIANLQSSQQRLLDLAGDGTLDLVSFGAISGYYQREKSGEWRQFTPFKQAPVVDWSDPNLKFIDLNGDGHADILLSEHDVFVWFPSKAHEGYGPPQRVQKLTDEKEGARLVFSDLHQSIFLADMTGDGLVDIVRIRNGEVSYWPNQGYCHFGAKVTMDHSPIFEHPEVFDQKRIRLADIDGSGTTDIVYLGRASISLWFNQSGNGWNEPIHLRGLPIADNLASVNVLDLLGNGTACIVWSTRSPGYHSSPMYYIDLMGGQKPHLLKSVINNLGAETHLHYLPSTYFYLQDKAKGQPWITRLPFPVQVVDRVETLDRISGNRFVTSYGYRHGYFDGVEREFRGFGYVEQVDTEAFEQFEAENDTSDSEEGLYVPPVKTKTWFHTGFYRNREHISQQFAEEYYQGDTQAILLPDTVLPEGLSLEEEHEACRALKGQVLRQEVYALDNQEESDHPYSVTESNYTLKLLQSKREGQYGVFFAHPKESLSYQYERNPEDPRIAHEVTLAVDEYGNVTQSVAIAYPRRSSALPDETRLRNLQSQTLATYTEARFSNEGNEADVYWAGIPIETQQFEIAGLQPSGVQPFTFTQLESTIATATEIAYEAPSSTGISRRLIERDRTLYYNSNQTGALLVGEIVAPILPFESYRQAFTPGLLEQVFNTKIDTAALGTVISDEGQYRDLDGDGNWWIPSGQQVFDRNQFFLPVEFRDPFIGTGDEPYRTTYDRYGLLVEETVDPIGNRVQVTNNYRVLQPQLMIDPNGNRSEVAFDALGMVVGTAVMGKADETLGDFLAEFVPDLDEATIQAHLADPLANPEEVLSNATTRLIYDLEAYRRTEQTATVQSVVVYTMARETHTADLADGERSKIQHSFLYSDGFGRELQTKIQAEPGPLDSNDPNSPVVDPRWVGTGRTVYNNKGDPVKQYEPFFSDTPLYDAEIELVEQGVTPILFYDPLQRTIATVLPNHTYEKVVFDAWQQTTWDVNDTISQTDPTEDEDVGGYLVGLDEGDYFPTWLTQNQGGSPIQQDAARKAIAHAGTPTVVHLDTLGRTIITIADNGEIDGQPQRYQTAVELDIEGNQRSVTDALGRVVMTYDYDMLGNVIRQRSMEAGDRFMLNNVAENPIRQWDSRGHQIRSQYDRLQRPTHVFMQPEDGAELLVERLVYGDEPDLGIEATNRNLRGQLYQHYEQAGVVTSERFDFKGNLLASSRRLAREYRRVVDWTALTQNTGANITALAEPSLEPERFTSRTRYDALNRPVMMVTPSNRVTLPNVIQPRYNEANLLEQVDVWFRQSTVPDGLLDPSTADLAAVTNINYNEKGQRTQIEYGNGAITTYRYEEETFRLTRLLTMRPQSEGNEDQSVQDYRYTYDPVGNITHIADNADIQNTIFFRNQRVEPNASYTYDALYRLTAATGREHLGQTGGQLNPPRQTNHDDSFRTNLPHPHDGNAMGNYREEYTYDPVGNILSMVHTALGSGSWTRRYTYEEQSLLEPGQVSNRLSATSLPGELPGQLGARYEYDAHGNMVRMPHLPIMEWDYRDQLQASSRQVRNGGTPEITYYVYDVSGERVRKVTDWQADAGQVGNKRKERIYLGGFEIYREFDGSGSFVNLERETLQVMDDRQRIALVEIRTKGNDGSPGRVTRFQFGNHLGSACLELDLKSGIISYEEYHPFGSSAFQGVLRERKLPQKRYRYIFKEQDNENGLYYHGARYYGPWLNRWINCDPKGLIDGENLYRMAKNNPIYFTDKTGFASDRTETDIVKPETTKVLKKYGINQIDEVTFKLYDKDKKPVFDPKTGKHIGGRLDKIYKDPRSGLDSRIGKYEAFIGHENKGKKIDKLHTNQPVYVPKFESSEGGFAKITSRKKRKLKALGLKKGDFIRFTENNYFRVGLENRTDFESTIQEVADEAKKLSSIESSLKENGNKASLKRLGMKASKVIPFVGIGFGIYSTGAEAAEGNYGTATLDAIGLFPVVGDAVDAVRLIFDVREAVYDFLEVDTVASELGKKAKEAASSIGLSEEFSSILGTAAATISAETIAPSIALKRKVFEWFK